MTFGGLLEGAPRPKGKFRNLRNFSPMGFEMGNVK
jgi:hypothetical protein